MKITIKTKSNPEGQTFTCSGFEYPTKPGEIWFILTDRDGDEIHMFAVEDILYIGIDYDEEPEEEPLPPTDKEVIYHKTGTLKFGLGKPVAFP